MVGPTNSRRKKKVKVNEVDEMLAGAFGMGSEESDDKKTYFNYLRDNIYNFFIERKIILRPLGNVIYIMPPYIISSAELELIYTAILEFLDELKFKKNKFTNY